MKAVIKKTESEKLRLKQLEEYYQNKLSQYQTWLHKADQLFSAAKILEAKIKSDFISADQLSGAEKSEKLPFDLLGIYFLLVGFALENSIKAKWIKKKRRGLKNEVLPDSELPPELRTHNLLLLAKKAGLNLKDDQSDLLRRIKEHVEWASRYPVPTKAENLSPQVLFGSDLRKVNNLILELNRQLWKKRF